MHALVAGDKIGEARIQCVKPFHKDRLPLPERHGRRIPLLFPSDEIESRKPHRLSFQKCGDISFETVQIKRVDIFPVFPLHFASISEIVIQRDHDRMRPIHLQVDDETPHEGGLSRG